MSENSSVEEAPVREKVSENSKVKEALGGLKDISEIIEQGKEILKEVKVSKIEREDIPVHCDLAASFGKLNKDSILQLDDELKVIIAGTTREIGKLKDRSWKNVEAAMLQNNLLQPLENSAVTRSDRLLKEGKNYFKFSGDPDRTIVNEVNSWFVKLISDQDVLRDTKIDIQVMAEIVAASGASVDSFVTFFFKSQYYEKTVVDIGIIRYPDLDNPFFKIYRIELKAWSDCSRILFAQSDKNGISGEFNSIKFGPRASVLDRMREATIDKAKMEAESMFD